MQYFLVIILVSVAIPATLGNAAVSTKGMNGYSALTPKTGGYYENLGTLYSVTTLDNVKIKVLNYHPAGKTLNTGKQPILLLPMMASNINEYLTQTTDRVKQLYPNIQLPANLASWAVNDENIKQDPLLYYSLAYYLWKTGYDVWLLNYRGCGYAEARSAFGDVGKSTIDAFALYDARAGLNLVYQVTGNNPVIAGHSTGGASTMMLLEGCYFKTDGHVGSDASLKKERNGDVVGPETIKGFIALEPAGIPTLTSLLDNIIVWNLLAAHTYLDLRTMNEALDGKGKLSLTNFIGQLIMMVGNSVVGEALSSLMNIDTTNTNELLLYFLFRYALDTLYICMLEQYGDWASKQTIREFFQNGASNQHRIVPPTPRVYDGYYYYIKNLINVKVPCIFFCATSQNNILDLVNKDEIYKDYYGKKTRNANDAYYVVQGAHIEFPMGFSAPVSIFPTVGNWLTAIV